MTREQELFQFIVNLAPEGETALVVRQKPVERAGVPVLHADGSPRYTWPAFLPDKRRLQGEAWYVNTGSFITERFVDGKPSAAAANCDYVLFMMLDDVGTEKARIPPLDPTWIIETSPGSYQYGYAFSEQPTKGEYAAAIRAIAAAGYSDPGATNAVRNCRLPGSVNLKPGRRNFVARLVEFFPDRQFLLEQICTTLGVVPGPVDAPLLAHRLKDTGTDSVLEWMNTSGMVLTPQNASGWLGIMCPNHAEHTDGQIEARYNPSMRAFCCYHGHCADLNSTTFLEWVAGQGGPSVATGLRDDIMAARLSETLGKLKPTPAYPDDVAEQIKEVNRREAARVEKTEWYNRFAYVISNDSYFDMDEGVEYTRGNFNALFRHVACKSIHPPHRRIEASICYDENRQAANARVLTGMMYAAGNGPLVGRAGMSYGNRWRDGRPTIPAGIATDDDVRLWLDHVELLVPERAEREHCLNVMAFKVRNPAVKINHAVLHGGDEGCGKDTMWAPLIWAVGGPLSANRALVDANTIDNSFTYHLESEILVLNELREPEARERRALANKLKPLIAAPPETLSVNRKGMHPHEALNRMLVLAFSNEQVPLSLASTDRRWFCIWSSAPRMSEEASQAMWAWYKDGGFAKIAQWLKARDLSAFNPAATPMTTEYKMSMIEHGMSTAESYITEMVRGRRGEFAHGIIGGPFHSLCDRLAQLMPPGVKVPIPALLHALKEAGWRDMGRLGSVGYPTKRHIFCANDVARGKTKSELRALVETPPATAGRVVVPMKRSG